MQTSYDDFLDGQRPKAPKRRDATEVFRLTILNARLIKTYFLLTGQTDCEEVTPVLYRRRASIDMRSPFPNEQAQELLKEGIPAVDIRNPKITTPGARIVCIDDILSKLNAEGIENLRIVNLGEGYESLRGPIDTNDTALALYRTIERAARAFAADGGGPLRPLPSPAPAAQNTP